MGVFLKITDSADQHSLAPTKAIKVEERRSLLRNHEWVLMM